MEWKTLIEWAGTLLKLLPKAPDLLRQAQRLTLTGSKTELGMIVIAILCGGVLGMLLGGFVGSFVAGAVAIVLYIAGVKFLQSKQPKVEYAPEGFLRVEGKEGVFCPKCWKERKELVPMMKMGVKEKLFYKCKMCNHVSVAMSA